MPYATVGLFLSGIMLVSGLVTLILLPGIMQLLRNRLFAHGG
jgi:hypothetical protein